MKRANSVLLVEDDKELRERYVEELEEYNYSVHTASDGGDVESIVDECDVDLIVSDTSLTDMDGDWACRELLDSGKHGGKLIVAISTARSYETHWHGIAHEFVCKSDIAHIGTTISAIHQRFEELGGYPRLGRR